MKRTPYSAFTVLIFFFSLFGFSYAFAQTIDLEVVGSAGDTRQHPSFGSLHWTVGEPVVETIQQGQVRLTQGFHQTNYNLIVADESPAKPDWALKLFPNPTAEVVTLETAYTGELNIVLADVNGQMLSTQKISGVGTNIFDLKAYPAGTYLLSVQGTNQQIQTFRILKINL